MSAVMVPPQEGLPAKSEARSLLEAITQAAANPAVEIEKFERLMAMAERQSAIQAARDYAADMTLAQSAMPKVVKDRHNSQTNSDYATLDAINTAITPVYTTHGFSLSFDTDASALPDHIKIVCRVKHRGGHTEQFSYDQPLDSAGLAGKVNKTPTHARGSAITYGRRYLTLMIFNLATGIDDDGNGADPKPEDDPNAAWLAAVEECTSEVEVDGRAKEMVNAFGNANKVPKELRSACQRKREALKAAKP